LASTQLAAIAYARALTLAAFAASVIWIPSTKFTTVKIGAIYPQIELGGNPRAFDTIGRAAEQLGYDFFVMFDHVLGAVHEGREPPLWGPYSERDPFHDPFVAFGYLAGITARIELVTGILVLPQRPTVLVARQAADVDLLSGGRLRLGVGVGWNPVEFSALGQDFHRRGQRLSEQIPLLRRLWSESPMSFTGTFDTVDRAGLNPRPQRQIPIYCGGVSDPAYRRAAKLADGFIFGGSLENSVLPAWSRIKTLLAAEGRAVESFGADFQIPNGTSAQAAIDLIRRWQDAGGSHAAVRTMGLGFTTAEQHVEHLAEVRRRLSASAPVLQRRPDRLPWSR
jgi:probable F420-dependent oxidoreductase